MPLVIGLTGGIGSGKSAAARFFEELGAAIVDTDIIAHAITAKGGIAIPAIRRALGPEFIGPDGALDRMRTRKRVFADPEARKTLEAVLHPIIRQEVTRQVAATHSPYLIVVIPLLFETGGYRDLLSRIAVVDCPEELQILRTMERSGLSETEVRGILATQAPRSARLAGADDVLRNDGRLDELRNQVRALHRQFLEIASAKNAGDHERL